MILFNPSDVIGFVDNIVASHYQFLSESGSCIRSDISSRTLYSHCCVCIGGTSSDSSYLFSNSKITHVLDLIMKDDKDLIDILSTRGVVEFFTRYPHHNTVYSLIQMLAHGKEYTDMTFEQFNRLLPTIVYIGNPSNSILHGSIAYELEAYIYASRSTRHPLMNIPEEIKYDSIGLMRCYRSVIKMCLSYYEILGLTNTMWMTKVCDDVSFISLCILVIITSRIYRQETKSMIGQCICNLSKNLDEMKSLTSKERREPSEDIERQWYIKGICF